MTKLAKIGVLALFIIVAGKADAVAQISFDIGPRLGYEIDNIQTTKVGADLRVSHPAIPVSINPTFDFYLTGSADELPDGTLYENMFQFTLNGLYEFGVDNQFFTPYAGPGISVVHATHPEADNHTELGLNVTGGFSLLFMETIRPFLQGEFAVGGEAQPASVTAGVMFSLN